MRHRLGRFLGDKSRDEVCERREAQGEHRRSRATVRKAVLFRIDPADIEGLGHGQAQAGRARALETVDVGDALLDDEDLVALDAAERGDTAPGDHVAAVGVPVIASDRLERHGQLDRRCLVERHAVLEEVDRVEVAGLAIAGPAPGKAFLDPRRAGLAFRSSTWSKPKEIGVLLVGDHLTDKPHADRDFTSHRHACQRCRRDRAHVAGCIDPAGLEDHAAGIRVDDDAGTGDAVAIAGGQAAGTSDATAQDRLRFVQLRALEEVALDKDHIRHLGLGGRAVIGAADQGVFEGHLNLM